MDASITATAIKTTATDACCSVSSALRCLCVRVYTPLGVGADRMVDGVLWFSQRWVLQLTWSQVKYGLYQAGCGAPGLPSKYSRGPADTHAKDCETRVINVTVSFSH